MAGIAERPAPGAGGVSSGGLPAQRHRPPALIGWLERHRRWVLAALLIADALLLLYMGRGLTFYFDEWDFVTHDYGGGLHSLLVAHVGNISIFPVATYKILFHLVGLDHYAVFRVVVIVLHLLAAWLVYVLAARRLAPVPALLATSIVLFLGAAWEDLLWPFQIGYLLSIVGGLAAWALLERHDRRGDMLALAALIVSVGSSSLGVPLAIGVAAELAFAREWRRGWVVAVPVLLYVIWYLGYGESQVTGESLVHAPGFAAELAAAASGAVIGRGLDWGRPLALLGLLLLGWWMLRGRTLTPRLGGLLATGGALWVVTAITRSTISTPETSRYVYLGAVAIVLIGVELLRGVAVAPRAFGLAGLLVLFGALAGLTLMHDGAVGLRDTSKTVAAELGALELAAAYAPPTYRPDPQRAPQIEAGPYLHTVRAIGSSPADDPAELLTAEPAARAAADTILLALGAATVTPVRSAIVAPSAPTPVIVTAEAGVAVRRGGCLYLEPEGGTPMRAVLRLPPAGVALRDRGVSPASLALRRFGEAFDPVTTLAPSSADELSIRTDVASTTWQLHTESASELQVCGRSAR